MGQMSIDEKIGLLRGIGVVARALGDQKSIEDVEACVDILEMRRYGTIGECPPSSLSFQLQKEPSIQS